jgi:hypothetical protein
MIIEFLLHEKDLWEITSKELLPQEVEFGEIVPKGGTLEYHLFMKKDKLTCGTIFFNVVDSLLYHATCERKYVDNKLQLCQG